MWMGFKLNLLKDFHVVYTLGFQDAVIINNFHSFQSSL